MFKLSLDSMIATVKIGAAIIVALLIAMAVWQFKSISDLRDANKALTTAVVQLANQREIDSTVVAKRAKATPAIQEKERVIRETIRKDAPAASDRVPDSVLDALGM